MNENLKSVVFEAMIQAVKDHNLKVSQALADLLAVLKAEEIANLLSQHYYKATFVA